MVGKKPYTTIVSVLFISLGYYGVIASVVYGSKQ